MQRRWASASAARFWAAAAALALWVFFPEEEGFLAAEEEDFFAAEPPDVPAGPIFSMWTGARSGPPFVGAGHHRLRTMVSTPTARQ